MSLERTRRLRRSISLHLDELSVETSANSSARATASSQRARSEKRGLQRATSARDAKQGGEGKGFQQRSLLTLLD